MHGDERDVVCAVVLKNRWVISRVGSQSDGEVNGEGVIVSLDVR